LVIADINNKLFFIYAYFNHDNSLNILACYWIWQCIWSWWTRSAMLQQI